MNTDNSNATLKTIEEIGEDEIINVLTSVMRECDLEFEVIGGSTRHYVRDLLIPTLSLKGYKLIKVASNE